VDSFEGHHGEAGNGSTIYLLMLPYVCYGGGKPFTIGQF
jgi:hypothetical protein